MTTENETGYRPDQVFTPSAPQLGVNFSKRDEEDRLRDFLGEQGSQLLIWGDTGVGKTSLVLKTLNSSYNWCRFQCSSTSTFDDIVQFFSDEIGGATAKSRTVTKMTGGTKFGLKHVTIESGRREAVEEVFAPATFNASHLVERLGPEAWLLVIDDFEKLQDAATKTKLAELAKALSDQAPFIEDLRTSMRVVFVGIAESAGELLVGDPSTWGRVVSLEVKPLTHNQVSKILKYGFELIRIKCSDEIIKQFTKWSDGYARYAHALGLDAARCASDNELTSIEDWMVSHILQSVVDRYKTQYHGVLERATRSTSGSAQVHLKIIKAMANSNRRVFTANDILNEIHKIDPNITSCAQIYNALSELTRTDKRGAVLRRPTHRVGEYAFADSLLGVFARMYFEHKEKRSRGT